MKNKKANTNTMKGVLKNVKNFGTNPTVLTAVGIAGMITSIALAIKGSVKATRKIDKIKIEKKVEKLPKKEVIKETWKFYIPMSISTVMSITCLIASNRFSGKKITALATAYKLSENMFTEYKNEVVKEIGKEAETKINKQAKDNVEKKHSISNKEVVFVGKGDTLFCDSLTGRLFRSDKNTIETAFNSINHQLLREDYLSMNEAYYLLGLEPVEPLGSMLKWKLESGMIDYHIDSDIADNGEPYCVIVYDTLPQLYENYSIY